MHNDYDNEGNNIVPCPICLSQYCPSKDGEKCPQEAEFIKHYKIEDLKQFIINNTDCKITDFPDEDYERVITFLDLHKKCELWVCRGFGNTLFLYISIVGSYVSFPLKEKLGTLEVDGGNYKITK